MTGYFSSLRLALTQISQGTLAEQTAFVTAGNALGPDAGVTAPQCLYEARLSAEGMLDLLWKRAAPSSPEARNPSHPLIRWTRWEAEHDLSGVGVLLQGPRRTLVVLPRPSEPAAIRFPGIGDEMRLDVVPNLETLAQSPEMRMAYLRTRDLYVPSHKDAYRDEYDRFLRTSPERLAGPAVALVAAIEGTEPRYALRRREDFFRAIHSLQNGMEFFLGAVAPSEANLSERAQKVGAVYSLYEPPAEAQGPATIRPSRYFGGGHPRFTKVDVAVKGSLPLFDAAGNVIGESHICAGGWNGAQEIPEIGFSAETSSGHLNYQQDSFYVCHFRLPGRPPVVVMVGADGLGGAEMGEMASSAVVQGIHAAVVEALAQGRIPLPHELHEAAARALQAQVQIWEKELGLCFLERYIPNSVASITVVAGNKAFFATTGDFLTAHGGSRNGAPVRVLGYTALDSADESIVTGTVLRSPPHLYVADVQAGDDLTAGSDGLIRNVIGPFKSRGSYGIRAEIGSPHPEQNLFANLNYLLRMRSPVSPATRLHDIAAAEYDPAEYPGFLDPGRELDNLTSLHLRILKDEVSPDFPIPEAYVPLETVYAAGEYHCDSVPRIVDLPFYMNGAPELFVGRAPHPEGRPTLILPDKALSPQQVRLFRDGAAYRAALVDGAAGPFPLTAGQALILSPNTTFEVEFPEAS